MSTVDDTSLRISLDTIVSTQQDMLKTLELLAAALQPPPIEETSLSDCLRDIISAVRNQAETTGALHQQIAQLPFIIANAISIELQRHLREP